jgi:signal transduction histidine kinase
MILLAFFLMKNASSQEYTFDSLFFAANQQLANGDTDSTFLIIQNIDTSSTSTYQRVKYLSLISDAHLKSNTSNNRERAINFLIEALKLLKATEENALIMAELNDKIGEVYDLMRQKESSKIYFQSAYNLRIEYNLKEELYKSYINLGINSYRFGKLADCIDFNRKALTLLEGNRSATDIAKCHFWLGSAYNFLIDEVSGNLDTYLDSAVYHAKASKHLYTNAGDTLGTIQVNSLLGSIYTQQENGPAAIAVLLESVGLIDRLEKSRGQKMEHEVYATTFTRLSRAYELVGDFRKALTYSNQRYSEVIGILMEKERTRVAQITEDYRTDKQLDQAEQTAFFASRKARLFSIGLIILVIALLISYLIFIQTLQKKKLENLQAMVMGEEQERKRVAKDLHDGIGVLLTSVKLRLSNFEDKVEDREGYRKSLEQIDNACTEVRRISHNMVPASLTKLGLAEAILDLLDNVKASTQLKVKEEIAVEEGIIDEEKEVLIYRIIQELINNSMKYAHAQTIALSVTISNSTLSIQYKDDGKGFDKTEIKEGLGLKSIASRVDILRGKLQIQSALGNGAEFNINIPIDE